MKPLTLLRLGRISNLPTVWSNVLAGAALAGIQTTDALTLVIVLLAMSLVYTSGMFFNDVFDREYDRRHRPDRPIPAGETSATATGAWGAVMLLLALLLLAVNVSDAVQKSWYPLASGAVLCALVLLYDAWHKGNPLGPLIMGSCRGLVYVTAALSLEPVVSPQLLFSALCLTAWVLGLTMVAKKKNLFTGFAILCIAINAIIYSAAGNALLWLEAIPLSALSIVLIYGFVYLCRDGKYWNPVTLLIAGICLFDALVIVGASGGFNGLAMIAAGLFVVTLLFQRFIEGS